MNSDSLKQLVHNIKKLINYYSYIDALYRYSLKSEGANLARCTLTGIVPSNFETFINGEKGRILAINEYQVTNLIGRTRCSLQPFLKDPQYIIKLSLDDVQNL